MVLFTKLISQLFGLYFGKNSIPSSTPGLDCADINSKDLVLLPDPHNLNQDNEDIRCEMEKVMKFIYSIWTIVFTRSVSLPG